MGASHVRERESGLSFASCHFSVDEQKLLAESVFSTTPVSQIRCKLVEAYRVIHQVGKRVELTLILDVTPLCLGKMYEAWSDMNRTGAGKCWFLEQL